MADLNNNTYWSETDASNNNASPNGWPEGMMPSGVNDSARADKGALKRFWDRVNPVQAITPSGGVWTFVTSNISYPSAYVAGEVYSFIASTNSAAGDLFRVNSLAARPIYTNHGNATYVPIVAGDIVPGWNAILVYNSTLASGAGGFFLLNPWVPAWNTGTGTAINGPATISGAANSSVLTVLSPTLVDGGYNSINIGKTNAANQSFLITYYHHSVDANRGLYIGTYEGVFSGESIFISGTGNVGIGGPANYKLDVAGTGHFTGAVTLDSALNVAGAITTPGALNSDALYTNFIRCQGASAGLEIHHRDNSATQTSLIGNGGVFQISGTPVSITYPSGTALTVVGNGLACINCVNGGMTAGTYVSTGATVYKPGGGTWTDPSDIRTKEPGSIADYTTGLAALTQLRPVTYRKNGRGGTRKDGKTYIGLVADDVLPVMPEMIGTIEEKLDPDDAEPTDILTLDATALIYCLVNSVKALAAEIETLKGAPHAAT